MPEFNPYAAPVTDITRPALDGEVWRDGKVLVMTRQAWLPDRCVKCNAPTTYRLKRALTWHSSVWYFLLITIVLYPIAVLIVRKTARVQLPLCKRHQNKRWKLITASEILCLGGVAVAIMGGASSTTQEMSIAFVVIGAVMFLAGINVAVTVSQLILVQRIDDHLIWLKKINGAFLDELPEWNR